MTVTIDTHANYNTPQGSGEQRKSKVYVNKVPGWAGH